MDFNNLPNMNNFPPMNSQLSKIKKILGAILLFEIGAFVGLSILIGFLNTFWITIGFCVLGYIIRPRDSVNTGLLPTSFSPRRLASTLFMIPGFLTDILAIIILIGPLRRFMASHIINKFLPDMSNPMGMGALGGNPFAGMNNMGFGGMDGMGFGGANEQNPFKAKKKKTRKHHEDIIDIGDAPETDKNDIKAEVIRTKKEDKAPKALPSDTIDI